MKHWEHRRRAKPRAVLAHARPALDRWAQDYLHKHCAPHPVCVGEPFNLATPHGMASVTWLGEDDWSVEEWR